MTEEIRRIGFFGGTFDPIHHGHLILASYAAYSADLDIVLFAPASDPPHKDRGISPVSHRIEMVLRAIEHDPRFELTTVDLDREGPHYSADTLAILAKTYPDCELYFLMGSDSFRDLPKWYQPERLFKHAQLLVGRRPNSSFDMGALCERLPAIAENTEFIDIPLIEISSTDIRKRTGAGEPIDYLVPYEVGQYVHETGLYLMPSGQNRK